MFGRHRGFPSRRRRVLSAVAVAGASLSLLAGTTAVANAAPMGSAATVPPLPQLVTQTQIDYAATQARGFPFAGNFVAAHLWAIDGRTPIVVLGAQLNKGTCQQPDVLTDRLNQAAQFLKLHPRNPVVVTGGPTQQGCPTEAASMAAGLRARGVVNRIRLEDKSWNTWQNATGVAKMYPRQRVVLVSTPSHLPRAISNFRVQGNDAVGAALF